MGNCRFQGGANVNCIHVQEDIRVTVVPTWSGCRSPWSLLASPHLACLPVSASQWIRLLLPRCGMHPGPAMGGVHPDVQ
jgi:hypothetical protein